MHPRLPLLAGALALMGLAGCGSSGMPSAAPPVSTMGAVAVNLRASTVLSQTQTVVFRVLNPVTRVDVIAPVSVPVGDNSSVTQTLTGLPLGVSVIVDVLAIDSGSVQIASSESAPLTIGAANAAVSLTLASNPLQSALVVANAASRSLSAFFLEPALTPLPGLVSPTFGAAPTVVRGGPSQAGTTVFYFGLGTTSENVVPVVLDSLGNTQVLSPVTVPGGSVTAMHISVSNHLLFVATSAASNNVLVFNINPDGSLGTVVQTLTVGGPGNIPLAQLEIGVGTNFAAYFILNGSANNVVIFPVNADGTLVPTPLQTLTVGGPGNTPVAATFPSGFGTDLYLVTNGSSNNLISLFLNPDNTASPGGTITVPGGGAPVGVTNGGTQNFVYVATNATSNNVVPFSLDNTGLPSTALTPATAGGPGNVPTGLGPEGDPPALGAIVGGPPAVLVTTSGASQNVFEFDTLGTGLLSAPSVSTAGNDPLSPLNL